MIHYSCLKFKFSYHILLWSSLILTLLHLKYPTIYQFLEFICNSLLLLSIYKAWMHAILIVTIILPLMLMAVLWALPSPQTILIVRLSGIVLTRQQLRIMWIVIWTLGIKVEMQKPWEIKVKNFLLTMMLKV